MIISIKDIHFPLQQKVVSFVLEKRHGMNSFEVDDISKGSYVGNGLCILLQQ